MLCNRIKLIYHNGIIVNIQFNLFSCRNTQSSSLDSLIYYLNFETFIHCDQDKNAMHGDLNFQMGNY